MVLSEWDKILSASPLDLTEQDKEEFFEKLAWTDIDTNFTHDNVIQLLRVSQEILKFKGEQVEYLVNELDTLAAVQSDDTGKKLISEHTDISQKNYDINNEDLIREQIKNEQLYAELQEKERDLLNEKRQVEKLSEQVTVLEQEKNEVHREMAALQRETREFQEGRMRSSSPDMGSEKVQELTEAVRQKNKHITQLLSDIETIERENTVLKEKLSSVKDELEDATHQMTKLAGDSTSLHHTVKEQQLQIDELEEQNVALRRQVSELVADKHNTDDQLDQLGLALDSRLLQWQDLLEKKDAELREVKQQLALSSSQTPVLQLDSHAKQIAALTQAIEKREDQVEDLQKKLLQATEDLNKSASVLEEYKEMLKEKNSRNGSREPEIVKELQKQVSDLQFRLSMMEKSVEDAEKEAQIKAEEVSNLIIQLREYESGEFGLNEAMEQVRELRQQKAVRDRHIEQLVQAGNQLQEEANQLEEENLALRDKLGLDVESVVRIEGVIARRQRDQNKIEELSRQVENSNDSQIQLKLENRELNKTISTLQDKLKDLGLQTKIELVLPSIPEKIDADNEKEEAQARLKEMIDENEALRKGMHEILDSIRSHDASSLIHIESEGLERLLEALDSRHVSGWYHPAMRLQAQLNTLYGINAALREQLHISRENETEKLAELQRAVTRIELMEKELMNVKFKVEDDSREMKNKEDNRQETIPSSHLPESDDNSDNNQVSSPKSTSLPKGAIEFIDKLKSHRAHSKKVDGQLSDGDQEVLKLMEKVAGMEEIMNETNERYDSDRETWQKVRAGLEKDLEIHSTKVSSLNKQLSEFKEQWETIGKGPDEMQRKIAENALRLGDLSAENETLKRKVESIQDFDSRLKVEYNSLQERFNELEFKNREITGQLKCEKEILQTELQRCRAWLNDSVLSSEMETVKNELNMLSGKHRGLLNRLTNLDTTGKNFEKRLQEEVLYWQKRSKELESELVVQKQKEIASQYNTQPETDDLVKKLAELNIKEDVNRLKVEHIEKMNNLMSEQVTETETRLKQIEHDLRVLSEQNLAAQLTEAELRNLLVHCPSTNELTELKQKYSTLEKQLSELKVERAKLAQEADLAREQLSTYDGLRRISDFRHDALQREILDLTAKSDDKATIGRLTREVTSAQMHETMAKEELNKFLNRINSLERYIRELEVRNKILDDQLNKEANNHIDKYRSLIEIIHDLHQRYVGSLPLVTVDTMGNVIVHLQKEILLMKEAVMSEKKTTIELQNSSMLSDVSNMKINSRIQELNQRIEIENLQYRVKHAEEQAQRQEKLCRDIQQELIELDTSWEKKLMLWEQAQLKLLKASEDALSEDVQSPKSTKEDVASQSTREASPGLSEQIRPQSAREEVPIIPYIEPSSPNSESLHQKEMIDSLKDQISQVSLSLNQETEKLAKCERRCNELVTQLQEVTNQLEDRKNQMISLKGELGQKNDQLIEKEREMMDLKRAHATQQPSDDNHDENSTEILALKTTVTSLQNIVNQKEETISRYQTLLKEAREEHSAAIQALRQEMNALEEELNKQTLVASSRVMIEKESSRPEQVRVLVEKYLCRIHELEDEMGQSRDQIKQLTAQLNDCHKSLSAQQDNMKPVSQRSEKRVEYVLKEIDEAEEESNEGSNDDKNGRKDDSDDESDATESENAKDHDRKDLKRDYNKLADQVRDQNELIEKLNHTIAEMKNNKVESVSRERLRSELERKKRRIEMLESKVEEDKVEISRLRHQLTSRPTRPEGVGSLKEEQLQKRIKTLEEDLNEAHQREDKERESHRNKCAEEVERWQERKRWQSINDKLRTQVKTQSTQIETLKSSQQRFRDTITRLERERNSLENKLKSAKGSIPAQSLIEDLEREVKQLKARNEFLKKTSEITSTSSLSEVIECQQRKIEALQIAHNGDSALTDEIERLQERKGQLQKANIRLEGENLKLKLELEKRRTVQLDSDGSPESDGSDRVVSKDMSNKKSKRSYEDLEKAVTVLRKVVEKLQSENKRLRTSEIHHMKDDKGYVEKLQMELQKAQESYMDSLDKISSLEAHLKMEKENYRMVQEQLLQKARLLTKCKILLERAAVREKALNEQVSDLQKLIPPESLQELNTHD